MFSTIRAYFETSNIFNQQLNTQIPILAPIYISSTVQKENLKGEQKITREHVKNNKAVRDILLKSNSRPEDLPAEEDI